MKFLFGFLLICMYTLQAKEVFSAEKIMEYLGASNPYISTLYNQEQIAKEKIKYHEGAFDTTFSAKYDYKDYPASSGEYSDVYATKKFQNGLELTAGYRNAQGTQEYNNIKTSDEGEMLLGAKLSLNALFVGTTQHKSTLDLAVLESLKQNYAASEKLRLFYLEVFNAYYSVLYDKLSLSLEKQLLNKAQKRQKFTQEKVIAGSLPELANIELQQQIINRKQRVIAAATHYENDLINFLKYLNISKQEFEQRYVLIDEIEFETNNIGFDQALQKAKENRADLKILNAEQEKLSVEKKNANLQKYPNFDVALYGVHDFKYENGFKVALNMSFPIERSRYNSQIAQYSKNMQNIQQLQKKKLLEISSSLQTIINSLTLIQTTLANALEEVRLVKKLEDAENKKYQLGSSNLFVLNQREQTTLEAQQKVLRYKLNYLFLLERLNAQMAINTTTSLAQ